MTDILVSDNTAWVVSMIAIVMRRVSRDGPITIQTARLNGALGITLFRPRTIKLDPRQTDREWRCTLLHELVHLARGPVAPEQAEAEEDIVSHLTALLLMPDADTLAQRPWSALERRMLADTRGVDLDTVEAALNPPTMPLTAITPRPVTQEAVALAARPEPQER